MLCMQQMIFDLEHAPAFGQHGDGIACCTHNSQQMHIAASMRDYRMCKFV
jgi:hypothetical protein